MAVLFITHDLGVVAQAAEKVAVMYAGKIVEYSTVENLFAKPLHPIRRGCWNRSRRDVPMQRKKQAYQKTIPGSVPDLYRMAGVAVSMTGAPLLLLNANCRNLPHCLPWKTVIWFHAGNTIGKK
jgi:ABC-type dipeptide/oligopeptide/nickel transport system ATPase component